MVRGVSGGDVGSEILLFRSDAMHTGCHMTGGGGGGGVFSMSGPPCFGPRTSDVF